jgi:hypothetical protein
MRSTIAEAHKPCHGDAMVLSRVIPVAAVFALASTPAAAINWDGHDDWLADHPAAQTLEDAVGEDVRPLPPKAPRRRLCQPREAVGQIPVNPYEPVLPLCPPAVIGN